MSLITAQVKFTTILEIPISNQSLCFWNSEHFYENISVANACPGAPFVAWMVQCYSFHRTLHQVTSHCLNWCWPRSALCDNTCWIETESHNIINPFTIYMIYWSWVYQRTITFTVGIFLPFIMDEYDQINKPIMTTVFNPLITRLWRINHV